MKSWDEMYEIARGYYEHQGNLLVPIQYVSEENIKLGAWIANQRKQYKTGKLTKDRIELLEKKELYGQSMKHNGLNTIDWPSHIMMKTAIY